MAIIQTKEMLINTILNKYEWRLAILEDNKKNKLPEDDYPYALDLQNTKEIIKDLTEIKDFLNNEEKK